jgi:hypothetical protein
MKQAFLAILLVVALELMFGGTLFGTIENSIIDVAQFGAIPDDGKDDTKAVLAALEECRARKALLLVFPKGKYDFFAGSNPRNSNTLFPVSELSNVTIDGKGSEFVIHGLTGICWFGNCRNLTLKNFIIDWDQPPYSMGKVIASQGNHFDVRIEPDYTVKGGEPVGAFMEYDPQTRLPMRRGLDEYYTVQKTELIGANILRIHLNHETQIKPGVLVLLRHQVCGPSAIVCSRCTDVLVQNVTIHTVPGMGFIGSVCTNITLDRFKVVPRPGRPMSATADATHFSGCKGTVTLKGCVFEGMGDDGANIKSGLYLTLKERIDDHTVLATHNLKMVDLPDPGDVMEVSHTEDLIPYAAVRVRKAELAPGEGNIHRVEFEDKLPDELREGDVFGNASRTPRLRAYDCVVRNNRARGMLVQTRDAIVERCKFINCTGPGIMVLTEVAYFFESIGTRDVVVRDCLFDNCNYSAAVGPGALCAMAYLKNLSYPPKPGVHKNVTLEKNTIRRCINSAVFAAGVDGLRILQNTIEGACEDATSDTGKYAIYVKSSKDVTIKGNRIDRGKQGAKFVDSVKMEPEPR